MTRERRSLVEVTEDTEVARLLARLFAVLIVAIVGAVLLLFAAMVAGIAVRLFLTLAGIG